MKVSKSDAIQRLDAAGHRNAADQLRQWRDKNGNAWGWDGWFRGQFPNLINTVWN